MGILEILAACFENHSRYTNTARLHKFQATLLCTVTPNTFGWNAIHVDIQAKRKFMYLLHFSKIFRSMIYAV